MADEYIAIIGHITCQIEHICMWSDTYKLTPKLLKNLRQQRSEVGQKLFAILGLSYKISNKRMEEFKNYWCYIKHYCSTRIHMIEAVEQNATYGFNNDVDEMRKMIEVYDINFWSWLGDKLNLPKRVKKAEKKCRGCKKDIKVKKTNYSLDEDEI